MAQEIVIDIDAKGNVRMEASGFEGSACELEMADLQQALGEQERLERKPEFHRREAGKAAGKQVRR